MTVSSMIRLLLPLTLVVGLSGCGVTRGVGSDTFKPYVPEVVQGNFVSREQRRLLRPGMTRAQVRDLLGTPLVVSVFHADRWDYAFSIRRQGVPTQQFRLTLHFQNDLVNTIEGDELPSEVEFVQRLTKSGAVGTVPELQATEEQLGKYPPSRANPASAPAGQAPMPSTYPPLESATR
ncbi:MAG: outer membrane protein assembly factor BamE [Limnohabitans sp.]